VTRTVAEASHAAQMCVFEGGRILQAKAERPIAADMRGPDERDLDGQTRPACDQAGRRERHREGIRVREVVDDRTDSRAREVRRERKVGSE
jgi:hypothetical protein